jgi:hypothetical protein
MNVLTVPQSSLNHNVQYSFVVMWNTFTISGSFIVSHDVMTVLALA